MRKSLLTYFLSCYVLIVLNSCGNNSSTSPSPTNGGGGTTITFLPNFETYTFTENYFGEYGGRTGFITTNKGAYLKATSSGSSNAVFTIYKFESAESLQSPIKFTPTDNSSITNYSPLSRDFEGSYTLGIYWHDKSKKDKYFLQTNQGVSLDIDFKLGSNLAGIPYPNTYGTKYIISDYSPSANLWTISNDLPVSYIRQQQPNQLFDTIAPCTDNILGFFPNEKENQGLYVYDNFKLYYYTANGLNATYDFSSIGGGLITQVRKRNGIVYVSVEDELYKIQNGNISLFLTMKNGLLLPNQHFYFDLDDQYVYTTEGLKYNLIDKQSSSYIGVRSTLSIADQSKYDELSMHIMQGLINVSVNDLGKTFIYAFKGNQLIEFRPN